MKEIILVPVDFSEYSKAAVLAAIEEARVRKAELHLLHIVAEVGLTDWGDPPLALYPHGTFEKRKEHLRRSMENILTPEDANDIPIVYHVRFGTAQVDIVQAATDLNASLIVMGTHGRTGITRMLMGSVAEATVRTASCPVMTVNIHGRAQLHNEDTDSKSAG